MYDCAKVYVCRISMVQQLIKVAVLRYLISNFAYFSIRTMIDKFQVLIRSAFVRHI